MTELLIFSPPVLAKAASCCWKKWRFVYSRRRLRGRVFRCKRLNTDTYGVATNGTGGTTILMSGSAPRATASTAARPRFVKCSWVLSRGRKCNRPVISVAPSHSVTVAITWNFLFFFFHWKTAVLLPRVKSLRSLETFSSRSENPENIRSGSVRWSAPWLHYHAEALHPGLGTQRRCRV